MIHIGKGAGKNRNPEDKFKETTGKPYNPYNNTGNYLIKDGDLVSPKEIVNIYLDK